MGLTPPLVRENSLHFFFLKPSLGVAILNEGYFVALID